MAKNPDYEKDVEAGKIIPRTPSEPSDEIMADYRAGKIIARPGMANSNLADFDFSQEALQTKYHKGRQEYAAKKYYEANIDNINAKRKAEGLAEITVDQALAAAKDVYEVLNKKGEENPERKEDVKKGRIIARPGENAGVVPPPPPVGKPAEFDTLVKLTEDQDKSYHIKAADKGDWDSGNEVEAWDNATNSKKNIKKLEFNAVYTEDVSVKSKNYKIKPADKVAFEAGNEVWAWTGTAETMKKIKKLP